MFTNPSPGTVLICLCLGLSGCPDSNQAEETGVSQPVAGNQPNKKSVTGKSQTQGVTLLELSEVRITERGGKDDWKPNSRITLEKALFKKGRFRRNDASGVCKADFKLYYAMMSNQKLVDYATFGTGLIGCEAMIHCPKGRAFETFRVELREMEDFKDLPKEKLGQLFTRLLNRLTERAADQLVGQFLVRPLSDSEIIAVLKTEKSVGKLMEAAIEAGERRLNQALPLLLELTKHSSDVVRLRAAAALGLLKISTDEVVRALARLTEGGNREQIVVAVGALSDIGGQRAIRYLENIAISHPDEVVRTLARTGTEKIKAMRQ